MATSGLKRNATIVFKDHESISRPDVHKEVSKAIAEFFKTVWDAENR